MNTIFNSLLTVDWSKVPAEVMQRLTDKTMVLSASNGSVYWAAGSGSTGKVMDLPLIPAGAEDMASAEQLLQAGKAVNGAGVATASGVAIGTAVVVIAIVVATAYLADKIDKVERSVNSVGQTVEQQDQREYLKHMSDYTGLVMAARELLQPHIPQSEVVSQAISKIESLADARRQLLSYIRKLPQLVSSSEKSSEAQYDLVFRFMIGVLDLMPSAIVVERELCLLAGKPALAISRSNIAASEFRQTVAEFRAWSEEQYRKLVLGKIDFVDVLLTHRHDLNVLFNSPLHSLLLGDCDTSFASAGGGVVSEGAETMGGHAEAMPGTADYRQSSL